MKKKLLTLALTASLIFGLCSCALASPSPKYDNAAGAPSFGMANDGYSNSESYTEIIENSFVNRFVVTFDYCPIFTQLYLSL